LKASLSLCVGKDQQQINIIHATIFLRNKKEATKGVPDNIPIQIVNNKGFLT
jgi:hypothetical protein